MSLNHKQNLEKIINNIRIYNRLKLIALNCFEWKNLPNGLQSRNIELALYEYGQATFFDHDELGYICLPSANGSHVNVFGESKVSIVNSSNSTQMILIDNTLTDNVMCTLPQNLKSGIRIQNNDLCLPTENDVIDFTNKLYEVEKAIKLNVIQQKFPFLITTTANNDLSLKTMIKEVEKGEIAIYKSKGINDQDLSCFNLNVPFVVDKLEEYRQDLENQILTYFGLNNANTKKKERLIVDEVNSNNDYVDFNISLMLKNRENACKLINEKYGLNIEVERTNYKNNLQFFDKGGYNINE